MKKVIRTIPVALALIMCLTLTAFAYSGSETVTLQNTQNEVTSNQFPCHFAGVSASNSSLSLHNVSATLQLSAGSGWSDYGTVNLQPGASGDTSAWGHNDVVYLCRAKLWVPGIASNGCTASATLNVYH